VLLLTFTAYTAYEVAKDPSAHLQALRSSFNVTTAGPSASFTWSSRGYTVTFTDTSTDNGSTITSWLWIFGDGTTFTGRYPPVHTYATACPMCLEPVALNVTDTAGYRTTAFANVTIGRAVLLSGTGASPSLANKIPTPGNDLTAVPAAIELFLLMVLIAVSVTIAGGHLVRRRPETVTVPVRERRPGG